MDIKARETFELPPIPELLGCKYSYTFDYGGSVIKVLYRKKNEKGEDTLHLTSITAGEHEELTQLLSSLPKANTDEVIVTGVGSGIHKHELQEALGVKLKIAVEFECFVKGFRELSMNISYSDMFTEVPRQSILAGARISRAFTKAFSSVAEREETEMALGSDETSYISRDHLKSNDDQIILRYRQMSEDVSELYPCLTIMCSSGFSAYKVTKRDGFGELVGYSPIGGRTLLGLGSLLTGAQSYDELVSLAEKGDSSKVDAHVESLKAQSGGSGAFYGAFENDALAYCFSHGFKKSIGDFKKEDMASAVIQLACISAAYFAVDLARICKIQNVIFCGSFINHHTVIDKLSQAFLFESLPKPEAMQPKLHICKLGSYLGAIGAWVMGKELEEKEACDWAKA